MALLRTWTYHFKHAFRNILTNRLIHAVSMGTITISLLLIGAFMLLYVNVSTWMTRWGESLTMSVYLEDDIDETRKDSIEAALRNMPHAEIREYLSKEKAMMEMREALGIQAGLLDDLSRNPFPASFEIVFNKGLQDSREAKEMKEHLEKIAGVDEVQYSEQWAERIKGLIYILKLVGVIIGGLLCIAVLFIVTNTIKLTIYSRRDEIEILKIVGATDTYVKMPFLFEGLLEGLLGGLIALVILFSLYCLFSLQTLQVFGLPAVTIVFLNHGQMIMILAVSLVLGLMGSFIALGRFFQS